MVIKERNIVLSEWDDRNALRPEAESRRGYRRELNLSATYN
jgi:hypothetical protein